LPEPINLFSDTQTKPTDGMRKAMYEAEVGDEQRLADPTTNALQDRVAELLGHQAGLFLPTGTMCNEIAFRVHLRAGGDEMIVDRLSHPVVFEAGGPASLSGAMINAVDGENGIFTAEQLEAAIRPADRYSPRSRLVSVEQTTNLGGGRIWPMETIREILGVARAHDMRAHMDGARLMNAVVASGVSAADYASGFDTAWIDLTKGLGAPIGAVLVGSRDLIEEAWRYKQMWGGAMRQSGIVAAAGLYALDHHVERLAEDHANATRLAEGLAEIDGVTCDPAGVETNIVMFDLEDAVKSGDELRAAGVQLTRVDDHRMRAVTHLDVSADDIERALEIVREVVSSG
jgi:threonine aldolase